MKKFIVGFLFLITSMFGFGCTLGRAACQACTYHTLSDNLFNKRVLRFYDIPWLKKPDNITEKSVEKTVGSKSHIYEAYIQDEQSFWTYGEYIYDSFINKDYALGAYVEGRSSGESFAFESWTLIKKPTSFEDCCDTNDLVNKDGTIRKGFIRIYYSEKGVDNEYSAKKGGYEMLQPRNIILLLTEEQDGSLVISISCCRLSKDIFFLEI